MGIVAINSGNNLVYLGFTTVLSFFVLSGLLSYFNLRGIKFSFLFPDFIFARVPTYIIIHAKNVLSIPKLTLNIGTLFFREKFDYIKEREDISKKLKVSFPTRGRFLLGSYTVKSHFPFAFFERKKEIYEGTEFMIFPTVYPVNLRIKYGEKGEHSIQRKGKGDEFFSLRDYREGEDVRSIHWKTSAKVDKLMMVENEEEASQKITLFIDNSTYSYESKDEFEDAITRIASLAYKFIYEGRNIALVSEENFSFGHSISHLRNILTFLSLVQLKEKLPLEPPIGSYSYGDIIYEKVANS